MGEKQRRDLWLERKKGTASQEQHEDDDEVYDNNEYRQFFKWVECKFILFNYRSWALVLKVFWLQK